MGKFFSLLHPNKAEREQGRIAEERTIHVQHQAAQQKINLGVSKEQAYQAIASAVAEARRQINVYDKHLNNWTAKLRRENPGLAIKVIEKRIERLPEAHIKIKEFVELSMRHLNE